MLVYARLVIVLALFCCTGSTMGLAESATPPALHRGVNTFPWFFRARAANSEKTAFLTPNTFPNISQYSFGRLSNLRRLGLDFIRIPVDPSPFLAADQATRDQLVLEVVAAADLVHKAGMTAVVDVHPHEGVPAWAGRTILGTPETLNKYQDLLLALASKLKERPQNSIVLEVMNEPSAGWNQPYNWFQIQARLVAAVRRVAPVLPLLVTGDRGGGIDGLLRLNPTAINDPMILYSFHYYEPMIVTHQGADWTSLPWRKYVSGIEYPAVPANRERDLATAQAKIASDAGLPADKGNAVWSSTRSVIETYYRSPPTIQNMRGDFAKVANWAKTYHIAPSRIVLGEFGVLRPGGPKGTVINYARDIRTAAEENGFAWCYFNYSPLDDAKGGFSMLTMTRSQSDTLDSDIVEQGLGLQRPKGSGDGSR